MLLSLLDSAPILKCPHLPPVLIKQIRQADLSFILTREKPEKDAFCDTLWHKCGNQACPDLQRWTAEDVSGLGVPSTWRELTHTDTRSFHFSPFLPYSLTIYLCLWRFIFSPCAACLRAYFCAVSQQFGAHALYVLSLSGLKLFPFLASLENIALTLFI